MPARREPVLLMAAVAVALVVSGLRPHDRPTWVLESLPVMLALPWLFLTRRRFPLTPLLYRLLSLHALLLLIGAHYTYSLVPLGDWLQTAFDLARNPYDRIGHLAQGFIPAILVRELLLRLGPLQRGPLLFTLVTSACLAFSALYELLEWWSALAFGDGAVSFLATQGDPWDAQWDMFLALLGAVSAQWLLAGLHDRQLRSLAPAA
jgi:putative membrane protein